MNSNRKPLEKFVTKFFCCHFSKNMSIIFEQKINVGIKINDRRKNFNFNISFLIPQKKFFVPSYLNRRRKRKCLVVSIFLTDFWLFCLQHKGSIKNTRILFFHTFFFVNEKVIQLKNLYVGTFFDLNSIYFL